MSKEFNPESDVKAQIERLLLEIKELRGRAAHSKDPKAAEVIDKQVADLEDQVAFLRRQLPEAGGG